MRLANAHRHAGNILVHKEGEEGRIVLIPINHGYCLRENSPNTIAYRKSLDAAKNTQLLKFYGWKITRECAGVFHLSTMVLKKCAERGLTFCAIGSIMCRGSNEE
ncbi:phosphatidylinositol 4-kinase gamma 3, partial [Olea europaea subsp. europaea]